MILLGFLLILMSFVIEQHVVALCFFIVGIMVLIVNLIKSFETMENNKAPCKLHKWEYDISGLLYCKDCKIRPGGHPDNYDKPY